MLGRDDDEDDEQGTSARPREVRKRPPAEGNRPTTAPRPRTDPCKMMFFIHAFEKKVADNIADEIDKVCRKESKDEVIDHEWSAAIKKLTKHQVKFTSTTSYFDYTCTLKVIINLLII